MLPGHTQLFLFFALLINKKYDSTNPSCNCTVYDRRNDEQSKFRGTVACFGMKKWVCVFFCTPKKNNKPLSLHLGVCFTWKARQRRQASFQHCFSVLDFFPVCRPDRDGTINEINISTLVWQDSSFNVHLVQSLTLSSGCRRFTVCRRCRSTWRRRPPNRAHAQRKSKAA